MMSHTVTVTRTTTSTTTSAIILNTGYCKTLPGLLKILQVIGGALCIGAILYNRGGWRSNYYYLQNDGLFFLCIATACFVGSTCLLLSCLCSLSTASIISKTLYEFIYHGVAFLLYLVASSVWVWNERHHGSQYDNYYIAGIIGFVLTILYLVSTVLAYRSYRGA